MHTRETVEQAIEVKAEQLSAECKAEGFAPEEAEVLNDEFNVYAAQYHMVQRLSANRPNMKNNVRRTQMLSGHNKIIQVINGFKL